MARPKTVKKPSKKALTRRLRKERRSTGVFFLSSGDFTITGGPITGGVGSGAGGSVQITATSNASGGAFTVGSVSVSGGSGAGEILAFSESHPHVYQRLQEDGRCRIESLDNGVTWHVAETLEPCVNRDGELVIGYMRCGRAPEHMRPGSGVYSFEIERRRATDAEGDAWEADRAAREAEEARTAEERRHKRAAAEVRARELLVSHLTPSQRRDLKDRGGFFVRSQLGNMYWVNNYTAVRLDERGVALQRYCIHAKDDIPGDDNALLRMLLLKCNEEQFLRVANPGPPSEWDLNIRRQQPQVLNLADDTIRPLGGGGGEGGQVVVAGRPALINQVVTGTGNTTNNVSLTAANFSNRVMIACRPVLLYINGVVTPLCG